ncbi:unnamed protein product [Urochloa humidicola]
MPRGVARGLELEAAVAAEAAWELRQSAASMAGGIESLDMDVDVDSPQHLPMEFSGDVSIPAPDPSTLNMHILDGEVQSFEVLATNPIEYSSEGVNRLIALQKRLSEASQGRKRARSTSAVNTSNSSPTPVSPVLKRSKRAGLKRSLV